MEKKAPNKWVIIILVFVAIAVMWMLTHNDPLGISDIDDVVRVSPNWKWQRLSSIGSVLIEGTITNISNQTIRYVKLRGVVADANGNQIGTDWTYADSDIIPPGGSSTFDLYIDCDTSLAKQAGVAPESYK